MSRSSYLRRFNVCLCLVAAVTGISFSVGCSESPVADDPVRGTADHLIEFAERELLINGKSLPFPLYVSQLSDALGPPDREIMLENNVSTWDAAGIIAYEKKRGEPVISLAIAFQEMDFDFCPATPYQGIVRYGDVDLTANSTADELVASGLNQDQLLPFLYVAETGGYQIIAELDDGLVEFSFGVLEK